MAKPFNLPSFSLADNYTHELPVKVAVAAHYLTWILPILSSHYGRAYTLRHKSASALFVANLSHGDLQRLALYWFHAPGLQLDNEVSQSTDQPHGTVCHHHYSHRTCRRAPSSGY